MPSDTSVPSLNPGPLSEAAAEFWSKLERKSGSACRKRLSSCWLCLQIVWKKRLFGGGKKIGNSHNLYEICAVWQQWHALRYSTLYTPIWSKSPRQETRWSACPNLLYWAQALRFVTYKKRVASLTHVLWSLRMALEIDWCLVAKIYTYINIAERSTVSCHVKTYLY